MISFRVGLLYCIIAFVFGAWLLKSPKSGKVMYRIGAIAIILLAIAHFFDYI